MIVGKRLRELRRNANPKLSQQALADELSLSYKSISGYEREVTEPSDEVKIQIAQYFNVSVDYLLGLVDYPAPIMEENYIAVPKEFAEEMIQTLRHMVTVMEKSLHKK